MQPLCREEIQAKAGEGTGMAALSGSGKANSNDREQRSSRTSGAREWF